MGGRGREEGQGGAAGMGAGTREVILGRHKLVRGHGWEGLGATYQVQAQGGVTVLLGRAVGRVMGQSVSAQRTLKLPHMLA